MEMFTCPYSGIAFFLNLRIVTLSCTECVAATSDKRYILAVSIRLYDVGFDTIWASVDPNFSTSTIIKVT